MKRVAGLVVGSALLLCGGMVSTAWAAPGDAASVLAHCGSADSDSVATSEVSGLPERTLVYGGTRLKFQQMAGATGSGWTFTDGWTGHLPQSGTEVGAKMPCFRDSIEESQVQNQSSLSRIDPGIVQQTASATQQHGAFGVNHLFLILFLAVVIALFAFLIPNRRRMVAGPKVSSRVFRRPNLEMLRARRRPKVFPGRV